MHIPTLVLDRIFCHVVGANVESTTCPDDWFSCLMVDVPRTRYMRMVLRQCAAFSILEPDDKPASLPLLSIWILLMWDELDLNEIHMSTVSHNQLEHFNCGTRDKTNLFVPLQQSLQYHDHPSFATAWTTMVHKLGIDLCTPSKLADQVLRNDQHTKTSHSIMIDCFEWIAANVGGVIQLSLVVFARFLQPEPHSYTARRLLDWLAAHDSMVAVPALDDAALKARWDAIRRAARLVCK
ncbi:hypothetical protein BC828DRAFT_416364 [Blastocladiella britannica]|nr:hypothetical protein BC828DRAFT_416364 [Blastocladiella britannica]